MTEAERIAQAALRRQQSGSARSFQACAAHGDQCESLLRHSVQDVTPRFNKYFKDTAANSMRAFQRAGIGEPFNGNNLRPGDIVYGTGPNPYGHAMIVGPNGQILDQYGISNPQDTGYRHPVYVVHPQGSANNAAASQSAPAPISRSTAATSAPSSQRTITAAQFNKNPGAWGIIQNKDGTFTYYNPTTNQTRIATENFAPQQNADSQPSSQNPNEIPTYDPATGQYNFPSQNSLPPPANIQQIPTQQIPQVNVQPTESAVSPVPFPSATPFQPNFDPGQFSGISTQSLQPQFQFSPQTSQFADLSSVVPQGSFQGGSTPDYLSSSSSPSFNPLAASPDYMFGAGAPAQQDLGAPIGTYNLSQMTLPSDISQPNYNLATYQLPQDQFNTLNSFLPDYMAGVNTNFEAGTQAPISSFVDNSTDPFVVSQQQQQSLPNTGEVSSAALGSSGTFDPSQMTDAQLQAAGASLSGGSQPQSPQVASAPPTYNPLSQGSIGQPGGIQTVGGSYVDPSTGAVMAFDPQAGTYTSTGAWSNTGYGAGSPYGAGSGGFAGGGFGGYGGFGSTGAAVTGHVNTGTNDTSVFQSGGVDPSSDPSGGPTRAMALPEAGGTGSDLMQMRIDKQIAKSGQDPTQVQDAQDQASMAAAASAPQQYPTGYSWWNNPFPAGGSSQAGHVATWGGFGTQFGSGAYQSGAWKPTGWTTNPSLAATMPTGKGGAQPPPPMHGKRGAVIANQGWMGAQSGEVPGIDQGEDAVHALLRPGETVFNKRQMAGLKVGNSKLLRADQKQAISKAKKAA